MAFARGQVPLPSVLRLRSWGLHPRLRGVARAAAQRRTRHGARGLLQPLPQRARAHAERDRSDGSPPRRVEERAMRRVLALLVCFLSCPLAVAAAQPSVSVVLTAQQI